jgi:hypothetical protein
MFTATIRLIPYKTETLKELSEIYCRVRDETGEGQSTFGPVNVRGPNGTLIGHISYNGRVWDIPKGQPTSVRGNLLYDNSVEA